jgi:hypothetical protein
MQLFATHPTADAVNAQDVSNTLLGCAKLRINPVDAALNSLLQAMARQAVVEGASAQAVSNTLWSVSELQLECGWQPQLQQRAWQRLLDDQQLKRIADGDKPQGVANVLTAVSRLSMPPSAAAAADAAPAISQELAQQCAMQLLQGKVAQQPQLWEPHTITNSMLACAQRGVSAVNFFDKAGASPAWMSHATAQSVGQVAWACRALHMKQCTKLMSATVQRIIQLLQQQKQQLSTPEKTGATALVSNAVAVLDMRQLAGDVRNIVASSGVAADARASSGNLRMLWEAHAWLVHHKLLDGQGLAGLLSQQQLEQGRAAAEAHHEQGQQQQQQQPAEQQLV